MRGRLRWDGRTEITQRRQPNLSPNINITTSPQTSTHRRLPQYQNNDVSLTQPRSPTPTQPRLPNTNTTTSPPTSPPTSTQRRPPNNQDILPQSTEVNTTQNTKQLVPLRTFPRDKGTQREGRLPRTIARERISGSRMSLLLSAQELADTSVTEGRDFKDRSTQFILTATADFCGET